jgi:hypothetical protein
LSTKEEAKVLIGGEVTGYYWSDYEGIFQLFVRAKDGKEYVVRPVSVAECDSHALRIDPK